MISGISYHCIYEGIHNNTQPLLDHLDILKPRVINVVGGAQKAEAFAFAKLLKARYNNLRVIWRNYPDDGNHDKERYKLKHHRTDDGKLVIDDASGCQRWVDDNTEYLQAGLTVLTDNESTRADLDVYAAWQAGVMDICTPKQWAVAVGRFSTGTPQAHQYAQLDLMWQKLADSMGLHTWSPNEYARPTWEGNGGNVGRFVDGYKRCEQLPVYYPQTSIGEWGICYSPAPGQLDPEKGYKHFSVNFEGGRYARFVIDNWKAWYKPLNVDICVYCWGGTDEKWQTFRVDNNPEFLSTIETAAKMGELEPVTTKPLNQYIPKPDNASRPKEFVVRSTRNIRSGPKTSYKDCGDLVPGDVATVYDMPATPEVRDDGQTYLWKWIESTKGNGWVQVTGWKIERVNPTIETPVVVPVEPTPPPPAENPANSGLQPIVVLTRADIQKIVISKELELAYWRDMLTRAA